MMNDLFSDFSCVLNLLAFDYLEEERYNVKNKLYTTFKILGVLRVLEHLL